VVVAAVETLDATPAAFVLAASAAVLGAAECVHGVVHAPLIADLATPATLGRYMALGALSWQLAFVVGPAVGGTLLDAHRVGVWIVVAAGCAVAAAWSLVLDPDQTVALYATYSNIKIRSDREAVLAELRRIARDEFQNRVTRNMVTSLYIARRRSGSFTCTE